MKEMHDDRVHARMAIVRELFGLTVEEHALGGAAGSPSSPTSASSRRAAAAAAPDADRHAR